MRSKDPELISRIKQYISEYYLEHGGTMPTTTQITDAKEIIRSTAYKDLVAYKDGKISISDFEKIIFGSEQIDSFNLSTNNKNSI